MRQSSSRKPSAPLFDKTIATLALGAALIVASLVLGTVPSLGPFVPTVRLAASLLIALGVLLLLARHRAARRKPHAAPPEAAQTSSMQFFPEDVNPLVLRPRTRSEPVDRPRPPPVAREPEDLRPTCPSCGVKMTLREPRDERQRFWSCVNYPRCRATKPFVAPG